MSPMKEFIFYILLVIVAINSHPLNDVNRMTEEKETFIEFDFNTQLENEENVVEMTIENFNNENETEDEISVFDERIIEDEIKRSETTSTFSPYG